MPRRKDDDAVIQVQRHRRRHGLSRQVLQSDQGRSDCRLCDARQGYCGAFASLSQRAEPDVRCRSARSTWNGRATRARRSRCGSWCTPTTGRAAASAHVGAFGREHAMFAALKRKTGDHGSDDAALVEMTVDVSDKKQLEKLCARDAADFRRARRGTHSISRTNDHAMTTQLPTRTYRDLEIQRHRYRLEGRASQLLRRRISARLVPLRDVHRRARDRAAPKERSGQGQPAIRSRCTSRRTQNAQHRAGRAITRCGSTGTTAITPGSTRRIICGGSALCEMQASRRDAASDQICRRKSRSSKMKPNSLR